MRLVRATTRLFASLVVSAIPALAHAQLRGSDSGPPAPPAAEIYHLKPSDVAIPPDAKPGDIRRLIQPFGPWTLICDENLRTRTRLCNASQTIVDASGRLVFSWSLAGTRTGAPVFILRAAVADAPDRTVVVGIGATSLPVSLTTCDATLCVGFLPLTPDIRRAISDGRFARVTLGGNPTPSAAVVTTTFEGLAAAIATIK